MFKMRFVSAHGCLVLLLVVVFVKIYQHNLYIKTMYEHQRLSRICGLVEKERNELLVSLYEQQQPVQLMLEAETCGMQALQLDAIINTTQTALVDFMNTTSTMRVLELCGLQPRPEKGKGC